MRDPLAPLPAELVFGEQAYGINRLAAVASVDRASGAVTLALYSDEPHDLIHTYTAPELTVWAPTDLEAIRADMDLWLACQGLTTTGLTELFAPMDAPITQYTWRVVPAGQNT